MKLAVDGISHSRCRRGFSVDNESNGRWERKLKRKGEKKKDGGGKKRSSSEITEAWRIYIAQT